MNQEENGLNSPIPYSKLARIFGIASAVLLLAVVVLAGELAQPRSSVDVLIPAPIATHSIAPKAVAPPAGCVGDIGSGCPATGGGGPVPVQLPSDFPKSVPLTPGQLVDASVSGSGKSEIWHIKEIAKLIPGQKDPFDSQWLDVWGNLSEAGFIAYSPDYTGAEPASVEESFSNAKYVVFAELSNVNSRGQYVVDYFVSRQPTAGNN